MILIIIKKNNIHVIKKFFLIIFIEILEWIVELQNKLHDFLTTLYSNDENPVLFDMY